MILCCNGDCQHGKYVLALPFSHSHVPPPPPKCSLHFKRFRFTGNFSTSSAEYERLLKDFFKSGEVCSTLNLSGAASTPTTIRASQLGTSVMSMDFFDRLTESGKLSTLISKNILFACASLVCIDFLSHLLVYQWPPMGISEAASTKPSTESRYACHYATIDTDVQTLCLQI